MYIPKSKFITRRAKPGEFVDGYVGPIIETASGEFFIGSSLDNVSSKLTPSSEIELLEVERPFHEYITPSEQDYQEGFYTRFILQTITTYRVVEVSQSQFLEKRNNSGVEGELFQWRLTGSEEVVQKENEKTLQSLIKDFPTIRAIIKTPLQFFL